MGRPGSELRALLETTQETTSPLAPAGSDAVAMVIGDTSHRIALASIANGRIFREVPVPPVELRGLAVSPDRTPFYYAQGGTVYSQTEEGHAKRLAPGDSIALDPTGRYLYATQTGYDPIHLARIDTASGRAEKFPLPPSPRIAAVELSPTAVDARGRVRSASRLHRHGSTGLPCSIRRARN